MALTWDLSAFPQTHVKYLRQKGTAAERPEYKTQQHQQHKKKKGAGELQHTLQMRQRWCGGLRQLK